MLGLENRAMMDLIVREFGHEKWDEICIKARIPKTNFVRTGKYSDAISNDLVTAASQCLDIPVETLLTEFGKFWITFTLEEGYGPLKELFGIDFRSCLKDLGELHTRMDMTMPHLSCPRFRFEEVSEKIYHVHYSSRPKSLTPMTMGLIEGLAIKYDQIASVELIETSDQPKDGQTFQITMREEV